MKIFLNQIKPFKKKQVKGVRMENKEEHKTSGDFNFFIPKQNNFKIPEGYFDELAGRLEEKIEIQDESPKKGILRTMVINLSIAAAVVIGVFLFKPSSNEISFDPEIAHVPVQVSVDEYMISMIDATEEWTPMDETFLEMEVYSTEEIEATFQEIPSVEETMASDLIDFFNDETEYEL